MQDHLRSIRRALSARPFWVTFSTGFACASAILWVLEHGWEADFYKLSTIMHHPGTAEAAFGYRLLLPSLALLLQRLHPSLTDHNCFIATQVLATAGTVYLSGEWAAQFLPRLGREFGYILVALMVSSTIDYWNFYDIAIVGFWTACLLLLYRGHLGWYVVVLTVGTFNHENTLLLIPCSLLYLWPRMKRSRVLVFVAAQAAAWCAVRYVVVHFTPSGPIFANHFWDNVHFWSYYWKRQSLFLNVIGYLPWWVLAGLGWRRSPYFLRCAAVSLPELIVITFIFGRFSESRQFVAFIPAAIGLIACVVRDQLGLPGLEDEEGGAAKASAGSLTPAQPHPTR